MIVGSGKGLAQSVVSQINNIAKNTLTISNVAEIRPVSRLSHCKYWIFPRKNLSMHYFLQSDQNSIFSMLAPTNIAINRVNSDEI